MGVIQPQRAFPHVSMIEPGTSVVAMIVCAFIMDGGHSLYLDWNWFISNRRGYFPSNRPFIAHLVVCSSSTSDGCCEGIMCVYGRVCACLGRVEGGHGCAFDSCSLSSRHRLPVICGVTAARMGNACVCVHVCVCSCWRVGTRLSCVPSCR